MRPRDRPPRPVSSALQGRPGSGSRRTRVEIAMERRVLLAMFLSLMVVYAYQALFVKPVPKPPPATTTAQVTTPGTAAQPSAAASTPPPAPARVEAAPSTAAAVVGEPSEREIRIETRTVIAVFTNRGARLKSWRLKQYLDS